MRDNMLVWCAHSCRRDVFLQEYEAGNLPNYSSVIERGMLFSSAIVGGHFQRTSNLSEITGRPFNSAVHPRENILNAAAASGATVGVVNDFIITMGAQWMAAQGLIQSIDEVYPQLIERPLIANYGEPNLEFKPDVSPERWLYWFRERSTHRLFYNFVLAFEHEGGLLVDVVNDNAGFVRDQQRYSLRLQDRWFGTTLRHLEAEGRLDDTVILVFSTHGTSAEGWLPLMGRATRANVDHAGLNFHPNVSRAWAFIAGPGIGSGRVDDWISIMDLKPTLCRLLDLPDLGGSTYGVDLLNANLSGDRLLADVTSREYYSLFRPLSGWLLISGGLDEEAEMTTVAGLPTSRNGTLAFNLNEDPACTRIQTEAFWASNEPAVFAAEVERLGLQSLDRN